jgi:hypothetical protein
MLGIKKSPESPGGAEKLSDSCTTFSTATGLAGLAKIGPGISAPS